ncbi:hypothetical protein WG915_08885 [Corynebacterium sp. H128]|uniref:hypothetical protein n=1 Tax=Corynebacterium sp. H128 TaxID=3133427 RepID=UPI0030A6F744
MTLNPIQKVEYAIGEAIAENGMFLFESCSTGHGTHRKIAVRIYDADHEEAPFETFEMPLSMVTSMHQDQLNRHVRRIIALKFPPAWSGDFLPVFRATQELLSELSIGFPQWGEIMLKHQQHYESMWANAFMRMGETPEQIARMGKAYLSASPADSMPRPGDLFHAYYDELERAGAGQ